jgi:tetratricopeptide (TPR) repeat protein
MSAEQSSQSIKKDANPRAAEDISAEVLQATIRADALALDATTKANAQALEAIEKSSSQSIDAVTRSSIATYAAAKDVLEHTEWVVSIAGLIVGGVVSLAAFFGFRSLRGIADSVREEAVRQVQEERGEFTKTMRAVTKFTIRAQAALRQALAAEQWTELDSNKREAWNHAIIAIKEARAAITTLSEEFGDARTLSWTYSFEAYCLLAQGHFREAIAQQVIALQVSSVDDPLDRYNLACMHAKAGDATAARAALTIAIQRDSQYLTQAKQDLDFLPLRKLGQLVDLLGPADEETGPITGAAPQKGPPVPGTPDSSGQPVGQPS